MRVSLVLAGLLLIAVPAASASAVGGLPVGASIDDGTVCAGYGLASELGSTFCVDSDSDDCIVGETRRTFAGPMTFCYVPA